MPFIRVSDHCVIDFEHLVLRWIRSNIAIQRRSNRHPTVNPGHGRTTVVQRVLPSGVSDDLPYTRSWTVHEASVRDFIQLSIVACRDAYVIFHKDIRTTARSGPFLLPLPVRSLVFSLRFMDYEMDYKSRIRTIGTPATKDHTLQSISIDNVAQTPAFAFPKHLSLPVRALGCLYVSFATDVSRG